MRRATNLHPGYFALIHYFYPRSPCGERQALGLLGWLRVLISIHALLAESDNGSRRRTYRPNAFLSTLSLRRATIVMVGLLMSSLYFYPRSPCGERLLGSVVAGRLTSFLSTLSLRRATRSRLWKADPTKISIHALLAESDA